MVKRYLIGGVAVMAIIIGFALNKPGQQSAPPETQAQVVELCTDNGLSVVVSGSVITVADHPINFDDAEKTRIDDAKTFRGIAKVHNDKGKLPSEYIAHDDLIQVRWGKNFVVSGDPMMVNRILALSKVQKKP